MLSEEENARLTQVGPGTPMGELMRRYWQPIATIPDLDREEVLRVRILGEDLVLYKTTKGMMGLVQERCPHRSASLAYGIPEEDGIRCAYHGWYYNGEGRCLAQPYDDVENPNNTFKDRITITAYPVEELGGLVWAYMGPQPTPLLRRFDHLVREAHRSVRMTRLPCNWLQCHENSADPAHFEWLHANRLNYTARKKGLPPVMTPARTMRLAFDVFEFGMYKRRIVEGDPPETSPDWNVGHPVLLPNWVVVGPRYQFNVPIDDTNTLHFEYSTRDVKPGEEPRFESEFEPWHREDGSFITDTILGTDYMAWITQGSVAPRNHEHLGLVDKGVILFRQLLNENIEKVQRGEDPMGTIRDPAQNESIHIRTEADVGGGWRAFRRLAPEAEAPAPFVG
jgi:5,5'-dehydrodivanillate O-demethylase